ncbi:MAG: Crp/Fnr family transcriptional regulator [Phormidesmis sp.]
MYATIQQLEKVFVFSNLAPEILSQLAEASAVTTYQKGEVIIYEGDPFPVRLHAIVEGLLVVKKVAVSGKETVLRQLCAGEMFAAPALFGDGIAPATVTALNASQIVTIDKSALLTAIQTQPEIAIQILQYFNQRLQEMHQTIHSLISEKAVVRLARLIQYTASRYGTENTSDGYACLNHKLPYQQMARMIGITYEECVRIMKKELASIVKYDRGGIITIQDLSALKSFLL